MIDTMIEREEDENGTTWSFRDACGAEWEMWRFIAWSPRSDSRGPEPPPEGYCFVSTQGDRLLLARTSLGDPASDADCRRLLAEARERGTTW